MTSNRLLLMVGLVVMAWLPIERYFEQYWGGS
jgi:hypothetical protein